MSPHIVNLNGEFSLEITTYADIVSQYHTASLNHDLIESCFHPLSCCTGADQFLEQLLQVQQMK